MAKGIKKLVMHPAFLIFFGAILGWEIYVRLANVAIYVLPSPSLAIMKIIEEPVFFYNHFKITFFETIVGFSLGVGIGYGLALAMCFIRGFKRGLVPNLILFRSIPILALAPLFMIWFGFTILPIILIAAIITFLPVAINTIAGFNSVSTPVLEMLHSCAASKFQIFRHAQFYASLPYLFSALKVAITLAVIGAIVGEWMGTNEGLGYLIVTATRYMAVPSLFGALFLLMSMGGGLYVLISWIESRVIKW